MSESTEGPWWHVDLGLENFFRTNHRWGVFASGMRIALVEGQGDPYEANARLIAAAPDLLRTLRQVVESAEEYNGVLTQAIVDNALAAIAKAEGK